MIYCIEKIENAFLEYFEKNVLDLLDRKIKLIDIGIFPWHSRVEISFYLSDEKSAIDDVAAWKLYDHGSMYEGGWDSGLAIAKDLEAEWKKDNDILPFIFDFSSAITSSKVRGSIKKYNLDEDFSLQILNPDSIDSKNYCEWLP
ncbi:hypothetical protein MO867_21515 [Microbulbifer sp. OS29]|uniref:Uncharacterized protein n=1 Tax=Microbulbifer okhotskensis TaxID=2926617 RepID=A0A9X2ESE1_9GAMM|nr:hypothetical protein [Microbulbifer okhotskensis]MCO1336910.1 hypothetical protein [Microbulbifer okhotskensis]